MAPTLRRATRFLAAALLAAPAAAGAQVTATHVGTQGVVVAQPTAPPGATLVSRLSEAPYRVLDNVEGAWINLNVVPVRPMALTADQAHLYAVDTHQSVVQHYAGLSGQPADTFRVPWGPVSIAIWPDLAETELLVVCGGTHVLARLDRLTGRTLALVDLPFEPADIAVDQIRGRAFVACSGDDSVVEVDLAANAIVHTYRIPSKHPVFLSFDANGTDVLVAPMLSGNNSVVQKSPPSLQAGPAGILDLETSPLALGRLPDEDLFRIDPVAQTVEAVLTGAGTVLFAHGINPVTGDLWLLNTEAHNKDPQKQSEPAINGFAVSNRVSIATLPAPGAGPVAPHTVIDLDDVDPLQDGVQYDPARSVGQPYSLEFDAAGDALVTGLLTDNVTALRPGGSFLTELDLAPGSIPRQPCAGAPHRCSSTAGART
jgi:DNA-binding beta-propeller fold protein YncE